MGDAEPVRTLPLPREAKLSIFAAARMLALKVTGHQGLRLAKLRDRFGHDAPAMADDLTPRMKCAKCGSKKGGANLLA